MAQIGGDVIVACLGERPATEKPSDIEDLTLPAAQRELVTFSNLQMVTTPVTVFPRSGSVVWAEVSLGYDVPRLRAYMQQVEDLGLLDKVFILVGVGPLRSAKAAEWMRANVPGVHIPDAIIRRMSGAEKQALEGRQICIDIINEIREIKGVAGVHVMAYRQEETVAEIIQKSGVLAGREPWRPRPYLQPVPIEPNKEAA